MTTTVDTMDLARDERADLVGLLSSLTPQQWQAPTLCDPWRVRDVVAQVFSYEDLGPAGLVGRFLRGGLRPDRVNAHGVAAFGDHDTWQLLIRARERWRPRGLTAAFGGRIALTDGLIHHQDIRRPLGLPRTIPAERLLTALDFARTARPIGAARRIRGFTLVATDHDWRHGTGPAVEGPAEALIMAMAGRAVVVDELRGPGVATLAARMPS
jgi:uncharacterized protein (TIGR03083 family)